MSLPEIIVFFIIIFLVRFVPPLMNSDMAEATGHANNVYATYISTACEDAFFDAVWTDGVLLDDETQKDNAILVWEDSSVREKAVKTFYTSLGLCLNKNQFFSEYDLELMTPVIALVDYDGYYLCHNGGLDDETVTSDASEMLHVITPLQAFSEEVAGYQVRYYLSDEIEVYDRSGNHYKGHRTDVYAQVGDDKLSYLLNQDAFDEAKHVCIVGRINEQVLYYINEQNYKIEDYDVKYFLGLSQVEGATFCGLLDKPALLGFVQGSTYKTQGKRLSVYGFAMTELGEPLHYFIVKDSLGNDVYYCHEEAVHNGSMSIIDGVMYYKGQIVSTLYDSKKDCALAGAIPGI